MHLSDFDYALPEELIAQRPLKERDLSRLLVVDRGRQAIEHRREAEKIVPVGAGDTDESLDAVLSNGVNILGG